MSTWTPGPRIYNLFPLLAGPLPQWTPHLERAQGLGFDWVFLNPFQYSGYSGSLYSIKEHYTIDPRVLDPAGGPPLSQLVQMIETATRLELTLMMDLVFNHTAFDSVLVGEHPEWYRRGNDGKPLHPSAKEGDHEVVWGDLFEIDNADSADRDGLWRYWLQLTSYYAALGFRGFRCDAAYKVPTDFWRFLIPQVKHLHPGTLFFAESLGCPPADTVRLAQSGFDFIFNSSKWWDFTAPWCLEQYRQTAPFAASVSFPESHDTERLAVALQGDSQAVKLRYAFATLFSTAVLMPMGFEYGFRRRLDVVKTTPQDWETPQWDLGDFIATVNRLKASRQVFNEEGPIASVDTGNPKVSALVKSSLDKTEKALILLNTDRQHSQSCHLARMGQVWSGATQVEDLSPDGRLQHTADFQTGQLQPSGVYVLCARMS